MSSKDPPLLERKRSQTCWRATELRSWVTDVLDYALVQAAGSWDAWPGWKLVGDQREYVDDDKVVEALKDAGYEHEHLRGIN